MEDSKLKFEDMGLSPRILSAIDTAGYESPTPIQDQSIPIAMEGKDLLGLAQTGTGKTAAFAIPLLEKLLANSGEKKANIRGRLPEVLVIAPTRELADQINESIRQLGIYTKFSSLTLYGGVNKNPQDDRLLKGTDIVVACPGRLLDHIREKTIDVSNIHTLVIDEADTMFDMGFLPDIRKILSYLPADKQTLFFAATMPPEIRTLTSEILHDPKSVQIGTIAPAKTVTHSLYPTTDKMKKRMIQALLDHTATGQVMIFTRTKRRARFLSEDLDKTGFRVAPLQGNMSQNKRKQAINGFKSGKYDILVATDIASRGIDVSEVTHVINFDMPNTVDTYIHRIGRTGRATNTGEAFTFCTVEDEPLIRRVERVLGSKIQRRVIEGFDYGGFSPTTNVSNRGEHDKPHQNGTRKHGNSFIRKNRGPARHPRNSRFQGNKEGSRRGEAPRQKHFRKSSRANG